MGIKKYKPTSPGIRFQTVLTFEEITTREPLKALVQGTSKTGGRNNNGRITVRHRGGGHKRRFRVVDFKRDKNDVPGKVVNVEYRPQSKRTFGPYQLRGWGQALHYLAPERESRGLCGCR